MGTISYANITPLSGVGNRRNVAADVTMSASYATGGDVIPLAPLGLSNLWELMETQGRFNDSATTLQVAYTPNNHGLQIILKGTPTAPLMMIRAGTVGASAEVTNATNLSALPVVHLEFRGV